MRTESSPGAEPGFTGPASRLSVVLLSQGLTHIIRFCLEEADKLHMTSLSFPALGTGILGFPRNLVCRTLLREIHSFSSRRNPRRLREVDIVVHPSDAETVAVSLWFGESTSHEPQLTLSGLPESNQDFPQDRFHLYHEAFGLIQHFSC